MSGMSEQNVKYELRIVLEMLNHYEWVLLNAGQIHMTIVWVLCTEKYLETCTREHAEASLGPFHFRRTDTGMWLSHMTTEGFYP